jgi:DNA-binding NarL/FixJ family response regulator
LITAASAAAVAQWDVAEPAHELRVVIVDDHAVFAEALSAALELVDGVRTVGVAMTISEGAGLIAAVRPDVAVVDYTLPDGSGSELVRRLGAAGVAVPVVILTGVNDEAAFRDALEAGCAGYITKDRPLDELVSAVRAAAAGDMAVSPALLGRVLPQLRRSDRGHARLLTPREEEILALVAEGLSNKAIAAELGLRLHTVRNHVQNVLTKLGAHSKLEAVALATRSGLLAPPGRRQG